MLPTEARLTRPSQFRSVVREGVRAGRGAVVVHARSGSGRSRAGFVVSRAVGNAVTRNRVKRQLRHLVAAEFTSGSRPVDVVVRALPAAATGVSRDFHEAWDASQSRLTAS